ncbi:hypothetical protein HX448_07515 [Dehalogenimonas etheniformans]|uniref:MarR family winged helix-turn-helix transcriptional regulator n=1 Tax=Dehalogenimonas etheniformans TaxID=1536648 RepID=UPI00167F9FE1|nr:MarR family transcriptional regulator [Dehalogenimonas etheniformans]QNT76538.1 hypothetical protein HX448_07515 [Dehalogenimonas etheniformans]
MFSKELLDLGLTVERFIILHTLGGSGGHATLAKINKLSPLEPHSVTGLIKRMELDGLITKEFLEKPKNMIDVTLTEKGKGLLEVAYEKLTVFDEFWGSDLSEKEVIQLNKLLEKLLRGNHQRYLKNKSDWPSHSLNIDTKKYSVL